MIRQTGGTAVGEISTRSNPFAFAMIRACGGGMMPSCFPSSSMTRISLTRMRSLTRTRSSRRGPDRSKAIKTPASATKVAPYRYFPLLTFHFLLLTFHVPPLCCDKRVDRLRSQIAAGAAPHRYCTVGRLAIAYHQHVGNLLKLRLTDLISNLLLALVDLRPQTRFREPLAHACGVRYVSVGNRQHDRLHRREPQRERPGVVLDEDRDEPLEAAEDRAMDDHRPMFGIICAGVLQIEVFRLHVIELNRRALPLAADRIGHIEVDFRSVERAVLLVDREPHLGALERRFQLRFGMPPCRLLAHMVVRHRRQLCAEGQTKVAIHALYELDQAFHFFADLLRRD